MEEIKIEFIEVARAFRYSPDGYTMVDVEAGVLVSGHAARAALVLGCAVDVDSPASSSVPAPAPETAPVAAPAPAQALEAVDQALEAEAETIAAQEPAQAAEEAAPKRKRSRS